MKIAYLTGEYPRATDTFIQREVAGVRSHGTEVVTCSVRQTDPGHHVGPEQREEFARTFYVIKAARNPFRLIASHLKRLFAAPKSYGRAIKLAFASSPPGFAGGVRQLFYFCEAGVLAQHLKDQGVTHLHNHFANSSCSVAMLASEMSDIPYSIMMHGPAIFFEPMKWRIDTKIAKARFVACISHFCRSQGMIFAAQEHWHKMHIVHCGVTPDRYTAPHTPSDDGRVRALFVGRLAAIKGLPMLIDAVEAVAARGRKLHVTLIGDGPDRASLEAAVAARGLNDTITFAGYQSQDAVAAALSETDIFVLPSFAEGVPVVLMEAMASGVPVIAPRVAGVGELVEDGISGFTVPPGDVASLAERLEALIDDQDRREQFGAAGREKVTADFNIDAETEWLNDLFLGYEHGDRAELPLRPEALAKGHRVA